VVRPLLVSALLAVALGATGCFATKIVTVPLRVVGAATSVVPVVGDATHDVLDGTANAVDDTF
jgi:hypothetical protein